MISKDIKSDDLELIYSMPDAESMMYVLYWVLVINVSFACYV